MSNLNFEATETSAYTGFCEDRSDYAPHEDAVLRKYRHWRGRSGRSYVFSVYRPDDCPAYENAVVIVSERGRAMACVDLGPLPDIRLARLRRAYGRPDVEFQIHVLADRGADRRALVADLSPDA